MGTTVRITLIFAAIGLFGCSSQQEAGPTAPAVPAVSPKQPRISLAVESPTDPKSLKAGSPLAVVCTVTIESGAFEPALVIFEISESNEDKKRIVVESFAVNESKRADSIFTFSRRTKAPKLPGRYAIDAKVIGMDTTLPPNEPERAPVAVKTAFFDSMRAKQGAHGEFSAPRLEVEVRSARE